MQVSIVVPVHNAADTLDQTLRSIEAQIDASWEAVVVDDGSTDGSLAIAESFAGAEPRFRVVSQPRSGASAARNAGIRLARSDWLLFLDADDWIAPDYLEKMTSLLKSRPELDGVVCRWARVYAGGKPGAVESCDVSRLFAVAATGCPFAIHACIVSKRAVADVGGFNEHLQTCEEWHLWQKLARAGASFAAINDCLAFYRMRPHSLSRLGRQVYLDAIQVVEMAGRRDPAVRKPHPDFEAGCGPQLVANGKYSAALYWGGLLLSRGVDPEPLLEAIEPGLELPMAPEDVAAMLLWGVRYSDCEHGSAWMDGWPALRARALDFIGAVERHSGSARLAARVGRTIPRVLVAARPGKSPRVVEGVYGVPVEVFAEIPDLAVAPDGVDEILATVTIAGKRVGSLCLPMPGDRQAEDLVKDAIARRYATEILQALSGRIAELRTVGAGRREARFVDLILGEVGSPGSEAPDLIGDGRGPVFVDLIRPPGKVVCRTGECVTVVASLGGSPLGTFEIPAPGGSIAPAALLTAVRTLAGRNVIRVCLRQGVVGHVFSGLEDIRRRLRDGAKATGHSTLPVTSSDRIGKSLVRHSSIAAIPWAGRRHFETLFARAPDPWKYTSPYETTKYDQTLAILPPGPIRNALEIGCAEGHFTAVLAPMVENLTAADISRIALQRAAERCRGQDNVSYVELDLRTGDPGRGYDLILSSELLYFMGTIEDLRGVAARLAAALAEGGHLVMAHAHLIVDDPDAPGFHWGLPFGAKRIGQVFGEQPDLQLVGETITPLYRIQKFRKVPLEDQRPVTVDRVILAEQPTPVPTSVAQTVRWHGGSPGSIVADRPAWAKSVPIFMYHRIAPSQAGQSDRYCIAPSDFAEQLGFLRDSGFYSIGWDTLRVHLYYGLPLPGRPMLLTFDDGYKDFKEFAFPVLQEHGFAATVFVCPNHIGGTNCWDGGPVALLDWSEIQELADCGVSFGSHAMNHVPLTSLSVADAGGELAHSRVVLEEKLGRAVDVLAFPHGDFDELIEHLAEAAGYSMCLTTQSRPCRLSDRPTSLPRLEVRGDMTFDQFVIAATRGEHDLSAAPVQKVCEFLQDINRPDLALETARDWAGRCSDGGAFHAELAKMLDRQGLQSEALQAWRRAVACDPGKPDYAIQLSLACERQALTEEALKVVKSAVAEIPDAAPLHQRLGVLHLRGARPGEAEAAFRRAIELNPDLAAAHMQLVVACERQGRLEEALQVAETAAAKFPTRENLRNRLAALRKRAMAGAR